MSRNIESYKCYCSIDMKKFLVFVLLFIVACGGAIEEASVEDTVTTELEITSTTSAIETISTTIDDLKDIAGLTVLYAGHSFGRPFAENLTETAKFAGIKDHEQRIVFRGGQNGAPQAMWEDPSVKNEIKNSLNDGNVDNLIGRERNSIFTDKKGHAGLLAIDTGSLIWLNAIYGINPMDIPKIEKYKLDIREVAAEVLRKYS